MSDTINYTINIDNETGTTIIHGDETGVISVEETNNVNDSSNEEEIEDDG